MLITAPKALEFLEKVEKFNQINKIEVPEFTEQDQVTWVRLSKAFEFDKSARVYFGLISEAFTYGSVTGKTLELVGLVVETIAKSGMLNDETMQKVKELSGLLGIEMTTITGEEADKWMEERGIDKDELCKENDS